MKNDGGSGYSIETHRPLSFSVLKGENGSKHSDRVRGVGVMNLLILFIIGVCFATIVFFIGRFACPRHDRVPLMEVDHILLWTTLRRGWNAMGAFSPGAVIADDPPGGHRA